MIDVSSFDATANGIIVNIYMSSRITSNFMHQSHTHPLYFEVIK